MTGEDRLSRTRRYLEDTLLPFWMERAPDPAYGGFLSYFDRHGRAMPDHTEKTLLMQLRLLFTFSHAHRHGYGGGRCAALARDAADFVLAHYWDQEHGGWFWSADRAGTPTVHGKIGYGQCFGMYAFGEYHLATGDPRGREAMLRTFEVVHEHMADTRHGGYLEILQRDWRPEAAGRRGGDRKSLDVHMHMMEALTRYEVTGHPTHRRRLEDVIAVILSRMLQPGHGTGGLQFALDFTPLPAVRFAGVAWGADEEPAGGAFPLETTSYGHNVELAWLLLRAADALGQPRSAHADVVRAQCDSCITAGLDREHGGVYVDGPADRAPDSKKKQFWQQAEVLLGMLDADALLGAGGDGRYWDAFCNVHDFVFDRLVARDGGGEWYALCARDGTPLWDYLGDAYKISYHTVRAMVGVVERLRARGA